MKKIASVDESVKRMSKEAQEYHKKLSEMSDQEFKGEMKKYFNGGRGHCSEQDNEGCLFYKFDEKHGIKRTKYRFCHISTRENCLGCTLYEVEE